MESMTTLDPLMKEVTGVVREGVSEFNRLWARVKKTRKTLEQGGSGGRYYREAILTQLNDGTGFRGEFGNFPIAGNDDYEETRVYPVQFYGSVSNTGLIRAAAKTSKQAMGRGIKQQIKNLTKSIARDLSTAIYGDGTGILCFVNNAAGYAPGSLTIAVDGALNYKDGAGSPVTEGTHYLRTGMQVVIGSIADMAAGTGVLARVSSTDPTAGTVTFTAGLGGAIVDNDLIVRASTAAEADHGYLRSCWGMLGGVSDLDPAAWGVSTAATVHGFATGYANVPRATVPVWKSITKNYSGVLTPLEVEELGSLCARVTARNGQEGDESTGPEIGVGELMVWNNNMSLEYIKTLLPDVRQIPVKVRGGIARPVFSYGTKEIEIYEDTMCPYHVVYSLAMSALACGVLQDLDWDDEGGAIWKRYGRQDYLEAQMKMYFNITVTEPYKCAVMNDVAFTQPLDF